MTDQPNQQPAFQLLTCPYCRGSGEGDDGSCLGCHGVRLAAWTGSQALYWSKEISAWQLYQEKTQRQINNLLSGSLLLFGAIGLVAFGAWLQTAGGSVAVWKFYQVRHWLLLVFWLSTATDSYLFYRLNRQRQKVHLIPKPTYRATVPSAQPLDWDKISQLKPEQKIDVSAYLTADALAAVTKAWQLAGRYKQAEVLPIHLLISLLTFDPIVIVFSRLGVPFESLKSNISKTLGKTPPWESGPVTISLEVLRVLFGSYQLAWQHHQRNVELTEMLEALATDDNDVRELFYDLNVDVDKVRNVVAWLRVRRQLQQRWQRFRGRAVLRPNSTMNRSMTAIATPILNSFGSDLTLLARNGYLAPCIGRDREIEATFRAMQGGTRQSAILVGNSGVGKTTIVEGIAQRMVEESVPEFLRDKRLVSVNIARLASGAGASLAQERLLRIIEETKRSGNIILFFSDIHQMVGITAGSEGSIDLAGVLAKALESAVLVALATTTPLDYRRYIEGHSGLENVLEKVPIEETSGNEAIQILEAKASAIEHKNNIYFSYDAIALIVKLAGRYLHDRYLPEKAIEIMHEVAVRVGSQKGKGTLVSANDVAVTISEKTNIPLTEITKEESEKLLNLEQKIHERVVDQVEAVQMVASALRRARAEMRDINRPIVNLLFLGPTGVGKTELAKTVAAVYFGDEKNMIRLDMSEYQEQASINRLIGAPPGYTGSGSGGYLTEAVRKNPFSLVLLDEIEKAHPDIANLFLQVMDDGRLTDASGRTVDFTNVILIGTSNAGTETIQNKLKDGVPIEQIRRELIDQELTTYFRPELLNRFDGIIVFKPLTITEVEAIAKLMLLAVKANLAQRGISFKVTPQALAELAQAGFDPAYGARPLRRVIQQRVEDRLASFLLEGKVGRRDTVTVEAGGNLRIEKAKAI